jgi:predicted lipoprotein with Yx(FWY)xxD motif
VTKRLSILAGPVVVAGVALIAAGCGGGAAYGSAVTSYPSATPAASTQAKTVAIRRTSLGDVLVDAQGRTLYLFEKDRGMTSRCSGTCASIWPQLTTTSKPTAGAGLSAVKVAVAKQPGGGREVTYAGHPLYTYAGDAKPGDTKGQGLAQFGAEWYVLSPDGHKIDNG